jgi:hypothetical protein
MCIYFHCYYFLTFYYHHSLLILKCLKEYLNLATNFIEARGRIRKNWISKNHKRDQETMADFQQELVNQFGADNVEISLGETNGSVQVAIDLPDRVVRNRVKVDAALAEPEPVKAPFVCFPVVLPEDPELVWVLGRREDLAPDEASRALEKIEAEFWETKKGVELQRGGTDKSFAEFINHVPAGALSDSGLRRHYKDPETLHTLRGSTQTGLQQEL